MDSTSEPQHEHDCGRCIFLGRFGHDGPLTDGTTERMECDLYFCPNSYGGSLIARHSSDGPEYTSMPTDLVIREKERMIAQPSTYCAGLVEALRRHQEMKILHLVPAYGRDYKSRREIEGSLKGDLDFLINDISNQYDGKPINLPQIKEAGYTHLNVRHANQTKVCVVEVAKL